MITNKELEKIEEENDKHWRQFGSQERGYVIIRTLIAEIRRLERENKKLLRSLDETHEAAQRIEDRRSE
jgi:enoyl reductase-like protein